MDWKYSSILWNLYSEGSFGVRGVRPFLTDDNTAVGFGPLGLGVRATARVARFGVCLHLRGLTSSSEDNEIVSISRGNLIDCSHFSSLFSSFPESEDPINGSFAKSLTHIAGAAQNKGHIGHMNKPLNTTFFI